MTHGSLFSGIGGFDLAASWIGWKNVFHCEWNEFGQKVLKYYWPDAISYGDITKTDFTIHRGRIDVLTGGFPCQPFSMAGKRKGSEDDRHLWPEMLRAIREIQPKWIVGENVSGIISWSGGLVFEQVCADLEAEGYEVQPVILPAVSVNAPHRRDRVWFVAYSGHLRSEIGQIKPMGSEQLRNERTSPDTASSSKGSSGEGGCIEGNRSENDAIPEEWRIKTEQHTGCSELLWTNSDALGVGMERNRAFRKQESKVSPGQRLPGRYYAENYWTDWPTQSPVCSRNDGLPSGLAGVTVSKHRNESIKAYGNAIVPQVVYQIFKVIEQISCPNN